MTLRILALSVLRPRPRRAGLRQRVDRGRASPTTACCSAAASPRRGRSPTGARPGVDTVRIVARWGVYAPDVEARTPPEGFDGANHDDPRYNWGPLDQAIGMVDGAGMDVMLTVTGWGPVWGSEFPVKDNPRFKPSPELFRDFAQAVATRYGGLVDRYILWNEPSTPLWLQPQSQCVRKKCTPYSPHHYRRIVRARRPRDPPRRPELEGPVRRARPARVLGLDRRTPPCDRSGSCASSAA